MTSWKTPIQDLIQKFGPKNNFETTHLWPLLEVLTVLPEEMGSRTLRLGANRRSEILKLFAASTEDVLHLLVGYLQHMIFKVAETNPSLWNLKGFLFDHSIFRSFNWRSIVTMFFILGAFASCYVAPVNKLCYSGSCICHSLRSPCMTLSLAIMFVNSTPVGFSSYQTEYSITSWSRLWCSVRPATSCGRSRERRCLSE